MRGKAAKRPKTRGGESEKFREQRCGGLMPILVVAGQIRALPPSFRLCKLSRSLVPRDESAHLLAMAISAVSLRAPAQGL